MKKNPFLLAIKVSSIVVATIQGHAWANSYSEKITLERAKRQFFIENKGQWHSDVLYLCRMGGLDAWITKYGVNYTFYKLKEIPSVNKTEHYLPDKFERKDYNLLGHRVLFKLQNFNPNPACESKQKQEGYYNYFIGNDPTKHATHVGLYKETVIKNVYNGIDIRYYFDKGGLRYDYIVHPGADPSQIVFTLEGSDKTYVNEKGNLVFTTRFGEVSMAELKTYQVNNGKEVTSRFVRKKEGWNISLDKYDHSQSLIIDPLVYSTHLGQSMSDEAFFVQVGQSEEAVVAGITASSNYVATPGVFQEQYKGSSDIFITKLNKHGSSLVFSTFLGSNATDAIEGLKLDRHENIFVTGVSTNSFPTTPNSYRPVVSGYDDIFITKINANGTSLIYSTFMGGPDRDNCGGIAVDKYGCAYIAGTSGYYYPTTPGAYQTKVFDGVNIVVSKFDSTGSQLLYSTYISGNSMEIAHDIDVDDNGNAYIAGLTSSISYPVTQGAIQSSFEGGDFDIVISKLNNNGSQLLYSTYLGGSNTESVCAIKVDTYGNAYVSGYTASANFDVTPGSYKTYMSGISDIYVSKINYNGTQLIYSTLIGGSISDVSFGMTVDNNHNVHVTGVTGSPDFPVTIDGYQKILEASFDCIFAVLNPDGDSILYATFLGGNAGYDYGMSVCVDNKSNTFIAGYTESTNFDTTSGVYQPYHNGGMFDAFVSKFNIPSITTNIFSINESLPRKVFPNPSTGVFTVVLNSNGGVFELLDIAGKVMNTYNLQSGTETLETNLTSGMYFIREKESGLIQKLIIE